MTISLSHTVYLQYDFEKLLLSYIRFVEGFVFYPLFLLPQTPELILPVRGPFCQKYIWHLAYNDSYRRQKSVCLAIKESARMAALSFIHIIGFDKQKSESKKFVESLIKTCNQTTVQLCIRVLIKEGEGLPNRS